MYVKLILITLCVAFLLKNHLRYAGDIYCALYSHILEGQRPKSFTANLQT